MVKNLYKDLKTRKIKMLDKVNAYASSEYDIPITRNHRIKKKLYAKAIYDNIADTPDELAFSKADVLAVIEQDAEGCQGWWLCQLRGRQGLCPGNRLRLITSYDSGCFSPSPLSSPSHSLTASTNTLNSSICSAETFETTLQQQGKRRSWQISPNKVVTPRRYGDVYAYNCPQTHKSLPSHNYCSSRLQPQVCDSQSIYQNISKMSSTNGYNDFETYDTPKAATPVNYDCPKNLSSIRTQTTATPSRYNGGVVTSPQRSCTSPMQEESYDIPRPLNTVVQHHNLMTPSTSNSSLLISDCSFSSSSNRSSMANMSDYDVPRRIPLPVRGLYQTASFTDQHIQAQPLSNHSNCMTYDFPLPLTMATPIQERVPSSLLATVMPKTLPLELSPALDTLARLQAEATLAITRLLSFVSPNWRISEKLELVLMDIRLAVMRLRTALHDLTEFAEGALCNATQSEDRNLALKLRPLVRTLRDSDKLIQESSKTLDMQGGWTVENLARSKDKIVNKAPDSLDQLIACAQTLIEDVRLTTSFIQGNASLLFKRGIPVSTVAASGEKDSDIVENYDYVCFESKDIAAMKNAELRDALPQNLQSKFNNVIKIAETVAIGSSNVVNDSGKSELTEKDKMLVKYYAVQISTHMGNLRQAIDSFLETVEKNQPPKFFIAYGKFVVVSAYNLVTIGDIVHRNVSKSELKQKLLHCTDELSEALKTCVIKSKKAAAHFPSVTAVQEMVDSVVDISHLASDLKIAMLQTVQLAF